MVAQLIDVTKRYGGVTALEDISLALESGRVTAVLGPNGAGKTTAVRLMLGLIRPSSGRVLCFGRDPREPAARRRTGAMLQIAKVPETLTVRELMQACGEQGLLLFCCILTFPFLLPVSIPGVSTVFGALIVLIGIGVTLNRMPWVPRKLLDKPLTRESLAPALDKGASVTAHYRLAADCAPLLRGVLERELAAIGADYELLESKMAYDVKPRRFSKGSALAEFMRGPKEAYSRSLLESVLTLEGVA